MARVLVIEDSELFGAVVARRIREALGLEVAWAKTFASAREQVEVAGPGAFGYALVDINLPDSQGMEVVDYVIEAGIPPIIFTGDCSDETRDLIWSRKVVDYVLKEGGHNIDYLVYLLRRLESNRGVKVLLVDDSSLYRNQLGGLLRNQNFTVIECASARGALEALALEPDVKLVLADYHMADMTGFELVKEIRKSYGKDQISVVGMSYRGDNVLSSRFLKSGANDFIDKSFTSEQIMCRINQDIETLELIDGLRQAAVRDYLTRLYNRRHFYQSGEVLVANARRRNAPVMVAMVDIDNFKQINDRYGHAAGDAVICHVASLLDQRFRRGDIVARFGGEEFCVLAADVDPDHMFSVMDEIRAHISGEPVRFEEERIPVTVSIGVYVASDSTLQGAVDRSDVLLYKAKQAGRNRVALEKQV